jgi:hypothetical protein
VQDVLTANELTTVLEDMMCGPGVREVYEEFKQFLGFRLDSGNKYKSNIPMSEIDFGHSQVWHLCGTFACCYHTFAQLPAQISLVT